MQRRFFGKLSLWKTRQDAAPSLPFSELLSRDSIQQSLAEDQSDWDAPIYTPWTTLWVFLSQVLSPDHSCRDAVARLLAHRTAQGLPSCSTETGAYCIARQRLPERLVRNLACQTGEELHQQADPSWRLHGRAVKVIDGTTVSMPDTAANAQAFGKSSNQHGEGNFPIARLVALFCLASGAAIETVISPYCGKKTGELSLFRALRHAFLPGDILLGDQLYCTFCDIAQLLARGVDMVTTFGSRQAMNFGERRRLRRDDYLVSWHKPATRPAWLTAAEFAALPDELTLREVRVKVTQRGFRPEKLDILTTLLDPAAFSNRDIAELFRARWHAELDLRSLKISLQMDVLRCKSPEMVRKEIWVHLLAYNLLRSVMCSAAVESQTHVRSLSFKGTLQILNSFLALLMNCPRSQLDRICQTIFAAVAQHPVGNRPDRFEPRKKKRRPKQYPFMTKSRNEEKQQCL